MYELNAQAIGSIRNSAILHSNSICIGFPTLFNAECAIKKLNRSQYHRHFLKVELINDSPLTKILKYLKPQTKGREVKTFTFVKSKQFLESNSVPVLAPILDGQCILSSKSFLWIVFSFKSDAQKCLPKVQATYPDAVISEPPIDLTYASNESPYTVKLYKQKSTPSNLAKNSTMISDLNQNKPEKLANLKVNESKMLNLFNRFSFILNSHDLKLSDKISTLNELVTLNGEDNLNSNYRCQVQWKLVFCHNPEIPSHLTTKWSLIHNLFAQFYHLGARKFCFDGRFYWVQFDCEESYQYARNKSRALDLESLELISPTCKQSHLTELALNEITDEMNRYNYDNLWCFLPALELCCYVIFMNSEFHTDFIERNKDQLSMCECIFIKSFSGEIWLGFPDKRICKEYEKYVNELFFHSWKRTKPITMAQPPKKLLESIELEDLIGEAYDLAFLSNELVISRKLSEYKNVKIIQNFSFGQVWQIVQMDCPVSIEFEVKVWVGVDDLKKGNKAKARIYQIKFKMLHEYDEDDTDVRLRMNLITSVPLKVKQIMAKKLINSTQDDYKEWDFMKCDIKSYDLLYEKLDQEIIRDKFTNGGPSAAVSLNDDTDWMIYFRYNYFPYAILRVKQMVKVAMKMNRYMHEIPWCLNEQLDLYCLVIKNEAHCNDHFMEVGKNRFGNCECIFIRSTPGEIWTCFPDELICENSKLRVDGIIERVTRSISFKTFENISIAKPSLLESINFRGLADDAYDLAFLTCQLNRSQDHNVMQRNAMILYTKYAEIKKRTDRKSFVILMYNSLNEEHAARYFIGKLTSTEAPYFMELNGTGFELIKCSNIDDYYIINDKRKVLEKILQNTSLVGKLAPNSSTDQSTTDTGVLLDEEMKIKLKYLFVVTTKFDFKLTSGMISIIKQNFDTNGLNKFAAKGKNYSYYSSAIYADSVDTMVRLKKFIGIRTQGNTCS
uniref:Uncharacterized protein n=1 Tax=Tetranychus urticae TaxID=32264 RepID=T1KGI3_TETUR